MNSSQSPSSSRSSSDSQHSAVDIKPEVDIKPAIDTKPAVDTKPPVDIKPPMVLFSQIAVKKSAFDEERAKLAEFCDAYAEVYRKEERERFKRYEAEFTQELMAKYFSNKDIFGDDIIEDKTVADGETVKASRWLGTESYADPVKYLELKGSSSSAADSPTSNRKQSMKNSG